MTIKKNQLASESDTVIADFYYLYIFMVEYYMVVASMANC